jgi:cell division transport system permease protein
MQLIGARPAFIRRPFLLSGLLQGGLGGLLAALLLLAAFGLLSRYLPEVSFLPLPASIAIFGGIVLLGSLLGLAGSYAAVSRFLDRHPDELV